MTIFIHCDWCPKQLYADEFSEAGWISNSEEEVHFCSQTCAEEWRADSRGDDE